MTIIRKIVKFFSRLEDKIRRKLSHYPILYAAIGGVGVIIFWRGVWHLADEINISSIVSVAIGAIILLLTGVFVSAMIGNRLIISGLVGEKQITEQEVGDIQTEEMQLKNLQNTLNRLEKKLEHVDKELEAK